MICKKKKDVRREEWERHIYYQYHQNVNEFAQNQTNERISPEVKYNNYKNWGIPFIQEWVWMFSSKTFDKMQGIQQDTSGKLN